ncbi:hypothetical protein [Paraburkholderia madseniana]|nr:hypothetical protein [Paraburkholderia madseniana]
MRYGKTLKRLKAESFAKDVPGHRFAQTAKHNQGSRKRDTG